ncbi:MAG: methyl-accepting chemotaxis protein, partial [Fimbriimonadaceae bacterium]|nr:methyl-accepting chemotaxis protein [Alphaproteobacteria bacterium]
GSAISKALKVCNEVANGNFEARIINITEKGEAAELMHAINRMIDRTDAYIRESKACLEHVASNKYYRRIAEKGMVGSFGEASQIVNQATTKMEDRIKGFTMVVSEFESQMHEVVGSVSSAATELQASANTLAQTSGSVAEQSTSVAAAAEEASANVHTVAAATEELTSSISEIDRQVKQSSEVTTSAVNEVKQTDVDIWALAEASEKIGEVVSLISDIAAQTNLLALNATIEAARAGEAGKGFAVVASEVKGLASETAKATEEISGQVTAIQAATAQAVKAIQHIGSTIAEVNEIAATISASVAEQGAATQEIVVNLEQADQGTTDVSTNINLVNEASGEAGQAAGDVLAASTELATQGELMRKQVDSFLTEVRKVV